MVNNHSNGWLFYVKSFYTELDDDRCIL